MGLKLNPYNPIFLECFDTVGRVIWPDKTRSRYELSYNVFGGTLNLDDDNADDDVRPW